MKDIPTLTAKLSAAHAHGVSEKELQNLFSMIEKHDLNNLVENMCAIVSKTAGDAADSGDDKPCLDIFQYDVSPVIPCFDDINEGVYRWEVVLCDDANVYIGIFLEDEQEASESIDALVTLCKILGLSYKIGGTE